MPICAQCGFRNVEGTRFCGNCGAPVSGVAISSPPVETGAPQLPRRRGRARKFALYFLLTIGVGAAILALIMAIFAGDDAPTSTTSVTTATPAQKAESPIHVDLLSLWAAYQTNEVNADRLYKGKRLVVKGVVLSIQKDRLDPANQTTENTPFIHVSTDLDDNAYAKAYINNNFLAQAAKLRPRDMVTLNCNGAGVPYGDLILDDCSILLIDPGSQTN
jgi:hypothetical protein